MSLFRQERRHGRGKRPKSGLRRSARCSLCGRREMVPFIPEAGKPVLCRRCLEKRKAKAEEETDGKWQ
jgi:CxxC-x17-CxxC domain-containing protein